MSHVVLTLVALFVALPPQAVDEAGPNRLTPREIADGWLLLFDGETTFGWRIDGEVRVEDGTLVLGGERATTATTTTGFPNEVCSFHFLARWEGKDPPHFALPGLREGSFAGPAKFGFKSQSIRQTKPLPSLTTLPAAWKFEVPAGSRLFLRDVKVRHEDLRPIFNGKDLSGWKRFDQPPRDRSRFTVEDGVIRLKNGPGDLQSEGAWADFILQLDCKTNGKHLNSGVFFRCLPGEYQLGYEAQIHNAFLDAPTREYTLDVYDPTTNELKEKRKAKYAATDFGTGAIYRRQPARKQVARDFEWFTMTVVAQGRHLGVWVNGVLVTDWTDNRPLKANAREGCRLDAGPISLQGHDPTTDLCFRNLRVADLPRK